MKLAYYPGCSARSTSSEYDESVREVAQHLGVELAEIQGWTCCGATSAPVVARELALALPARNLALARRTALEMVTSCPACFIRHRRAHKGLERDVRQRRAIEDLIGMELATMAPVRHILDVLHRDVGLDKLRERVQKRLEGLRVVAYYGCYLARPVEATPDHPDDPTAMDEVVRALGAEVLPWQGKMACCGASLSVSAPDLVRILVGKVVGAAAAVGAQAIVTACGMCQLNLDMHQPNGAGSPLPIFYFSELAGLAFQSPNAPKWFRKHVVDPCPLLRALHLL